MSGSVDLVVREYGCCGGEAVGVDVEVSSVEVAWNVPVGDLAYEIGYGAVTVADSVDY